MRNLPTFCLRIRILIILSKSAVMLCIFLLLTSCAQLGLDLVKAGRNDYNIVLQQTEDDEVILNLVRVRYGDRPLFFDVNSVTTSFTWSQNAAASGTMLEYGGSDFQRNNLSIRGDLQYTERPTITYTPLGGKDFVKSVLTPADLDTLILLSNSGWSIERLLRMMANRMNGLPNSPRAAGPTPSDPPIYKEFGQAAKLMRHLQKRGMLRFGYQKIDNEDTPVMVIDREARFFEETQKLKDLLGLAIEKDTFIKYSFLLLDQLAALLGGKVETAGPLLTLPVSAP